MNERIKQLRKALGLTQQEFGRRIGIKQNSVAQIEIGRNTSEQTVFAICREFSVNETWLRTGEGEMFVQISRDEAIAEFVADLLRDEKPDFRRRFVSALARLDSSQWELLEDMANRLVDEMKKG